MGADRELPALGPVLLSRTAFAARRAQGARGVIALLGAAGLGTALGAGAPCPAAAASVWSPPATLSSCAALETPQVLFPSASPIHATGPGAVVWRAAPGCPGGEGARLSRLGADLTPGAESVPRTATGKRIALTGPLAASVAPHGELLLASTGSARPGVGQLAEGVAGGPFAPLAAVAAPFALARGYLGDVAVASTVAGGRVGLRVERYFARSLETRVVPRAAPLPGTPRGLSLALDFRTDALVTWVQGGALLARWLPASGGVQPLQRLASTTGAIRTATLLSDNNHAIVAFSEDRHGSTRVFLARSGAGVRFGPVKLLEQFRDPPGVAAPSASPLLVRLSSEGVMIAWAAVAAAHWVIRSAAIDQLGIGAPTTIAAPTGDALLEDLAPGPAGDALLLWAEPQSSPAGASSGAQALYAARGFDVSPDRTIFAAPEQVAPAGANSLATLALDPASDRALAVWHGPGDRLEYSIRASPAGP
ncbi:MAG TPA: hypothetical protein VII03_00855 [Solirubrobacteraceae bacterium]